VRVLTAGRDEALGTGHADVAVTGYDPPPRRLRSAEVAAFPQVLMVDSGHELAGRASLGVADLAGLDLVVPPAGRPHRRSLERALLDAGVPWQAAAEADGWDLLVHLASLGLAPAVPPAVLYHGTVARFLPAVREQGLRPGRRVHVHLSADEATAAAVGARRGRPVVLRVDAAGMRAAGHQFFRAANGVWLAGRVPPAFLSGHQAQPPT
jgi:hypothetical protein